jgi:beta-glucanase (GH16 family)
MSKTATAAKFYRLLFLGCLTTTISCTQEKGNNLQTEERLWSIDFFDDFDAFDDANWQDQRIWVNNESHAYVPDGKYNTREVSDGSLKIRVVKLDTPIVCDTYDKFGNLHPATAYVAGRICSKNRKEFVKGKWTARLKLHSSGQPSQFPAWWILGAQNNESPVQEENENVCWPLYGSGEIDIFEHHGDYTAKEFTTGAIVSLDSCDKGDWWSARKNIATTLTEYHEYSVEWDVADLVYRLDGTEIHRNIGMGDTYSEPMFAILNYAKITDSNMTGSWTMEVDWVKHEKRN